MSRVRSTTSSGGRGVDDLGQPLAGEPLRPTPATAEQGSSSLRDGARPGAGVVDSLPMYCRTSTTFATWSSRSLLQEGQGFGALGVVIAAPRPASVFLAQLRLDQHREALLPPPGVDPPGLRGTPATGWLLEGIQVSTVSTWKASPWETFTATAAGPGARTARGRGRRGRRG